MILLYNVCLFVCVWRVESLSCNAGVRPGVRTGPGPAVWRILPAVAPAGFP